MVAFKDTSEPAGNFPQVDLRATPLPVRSTAYSLKPLAVGTGMVESLWSYLVRLADAHANRFHDLYWAVVAPLAKIVATPNTKVAAVSLKGERANRIVAAVEAATMRTGLVRTTLVRAEEYSCVLVCVRSHRAWCAACLKTDHVPHDRLLWNVGDVTHCSIHRTDLIERCPSCRRRQNFGAVGISIDCCAYCGASLMASVPVALLLPDDYQVWVAEETAGFLAHFDGQKADNRLALIQNMKTTIAVFGGRKPLARILRVALTSLLAWERGDHRMSLAVALRWAWVTSVPIWDLLCRKIAPTEINVQASRSEWSPTPKGVSKAPSSESYLKALAGFLAINPYLIPTKRMLINKAGGHLKHPALNATEVRCALELSQKSRRRLRYKQRIWAIVCRVHRAFTWVQGSGLPLNSRNLCSQLGRGGDMMSPLARKYFSVLKQQHTRGQLMPNPRKRVPLDVREFWAHNGLT